MIDWTPTLMELLFYLHNKEVELRELQLKLEACKEPKAKKEKKK